MCKWLNKRWPLVTKKRHESACRFLSQSILENRRLVHELRSSVRELERRLWEVEEHTVDETLAMTTQKVTEWASRVTPEIKEDD